MEEFIYSEKTEKEKMLSGELYDFNDEILRQERFRCRKIMKIFNDSDPEEEAARSILLLELFGKFGNNSYIEPPFHCDYGGNIYFGDRVYMNFDCIILDCGNVIVGDDCLFGPACKIITPTHPLDFNMRKDFGPELARPVKIGNDCFFGAGCIILPGVTIGNNVIAGAGSVITKDFPSNVVIGGNPAKIIRTIANTDES